MSDLKICRICLRAGAKVYKYEQYSLKSYYEEVINLEVNDKDTLPKYFCFECATLLHKYHKFKEKCFIGRKILEEILSKGPITYEKVNSIERVNLNVLHKSPLEKFIVAYNNNESQPHDNNDNTMCNDEPHFNDTVPIKEEPQFEMPTKIEELPKNNETLAVNNQEIIKINKFNPKLKVKKTLMKEKKQNKDKLNKVNDNEECDKAKKGIKRLILLDSSKWKKFDLSEEDALQEFQAKAYDDKYTGAAFKCKHCFKGFSEEDMLKRHVEIRHSESKGAIECQFCRMRFMRKCRLRQHIREHYTKYKCLRCNFICVLESTALSHEMFHNGVTRKCKYCGKEFRYSSTYYTHLRTHRSAHVCAACGASFVSAPGLRQHRRLKHCADRKCIEDDDEINKYCARCNIHFETSKAYEEHLYHSTMHAETEDFLQSRCGARNNETAGKDPNDQITSLFKKRKIDDISFKSGKRCKKPTTCHQCGKHFSTQSACLKHHLEEHPGTSFCPPNQRHICEICGASLAPGSVAVHKNMHSREKIFACETCGRQFYESVGLKRHMLTHTGEKPYPCTACDKRFTQSASLKLHYRTFHLKQPYPKRNRRKKE